MPIVMGTAGHIDHGKSTLVKALTGTDPDRLAEEKKRGITIELGFASLKLPSGTGIGIVDVPGHERFVKNMVAGAAGIDFVVLVIAADEGVMPQTREHLEICSFLGIESGLTVLTKKDVVDEAWLEMVSDDVTEFLQDSFLKDSPVLTLSALTREGLDDFISEIEKLAVSAARKRRADLPRLPIDRVFTIKGHGTVVTGTLLSGKIKIGDDLLVYPQETFTKARSLQTFGDTDEEAVAGQRTAINLQGLEVEDLDRGDVLASPGSLFPSLIWDLEINCLDSAPTPLKHRTEIHFHHGTKEIPARLHFLDRDVLNPGEKCICQVHFSAPMVGVYGDHYVVRAFSPLRTVAGGKVISPLGNKVRRFSKEMEVLFKMSEVEPAEIIEKKLLLTGPQGLSFFQLMVQTDLGAKNLEKLLNSLSNENRIFLFDRENRCYVNGQIANDLLDSLLAFFDAFHKKNPMKTGLQRGEIASSWKLNRQKNNTVPPKLLHFLLERLLRAGKIVAEQEWFRLSGHEVRVERDILELKTKILSFYSKSGASPPNLKDVLESLKISSKEAAPALKLLLEENSLIKLKEDLYYFAPAFHELQKNIVEYLKKHEEIGPTEMKELSGLSRKYTIPILEYLDKEKITIRVGDKRRLRKKQ